MSFPQNNYNNNHHLHNYHNDDDGDDGNHHYRHHMMMMGPTTTTSTTCSVSREDMMLAEMMSSLQNDVTMNGGIMGGETSMVAETVLLDADEEDFNASSTPFYSSMNIFSWGDRLRTALHMISQQYTTTTDDDSTDAGDDDPRNSKKKNRKKKKQRERKLERRLQNQMEHASVSESVDSNAYEFRTNAADLLGDPSNLLLDQSEARNRASARVRSYRNVVPQDDEESSTTTMTPNLDSLMSFGSFLDIDLTEAEKELSFEKEQEEKVPPPQTPPHQPHRSSVVAFSPFIQVVDAEQEETPPPLPLHLQEQLDGEAITTTTDEIDRNSSSRFYINNNDNMDESHFMEEGVGVDGSGLGLSDALQPLFACDISAMTPDSSSSSRSSSSSATPASSCMMMEEEDPITENKNKKRIIDVDELSNKIKDMDASDVTGRTYLLDDSSSSGATIEDGSGSRVVDSSSAITTTINKDDDGGNDDALCLSIMPENLVSKFNKDYYDNNNGSDTSSDGESDLTETTGEETTIAGDATKKTPRPPARLSALARWAILALVLAIMAAIAWTCVVLLSPPKSPCFHLADLKVGRLELVLSNVPMSSLTMEKQSLLENLFITAYNNATGNCQGSFQRVITTASMDTAYYSTYHNTVGVLTSWTAIVNCNGCPDREPLFATTTTGLLDVGGPGRRVEEFLIDSSNENGTDSDSSSMINTAAAATFEAAIVSNTISIMDDSLPELFNRTGVEVAHLAAISMNTGEADQVLFEAPTSAPTIAPTTMAPTTMAPTTMAPTTVAPTTMAPTPALPKYNCSVTEFWLVDAGREIWIRRLEEDEDTIDWNELRNAGVWAINIEAVTSPWKIRQVRFNLNGTTVTGEIVPPYMFGKGDEDIRPTPVLTVVNTVLIITARPFCRIGEKGQNKQITITIVG